MAASKRRPGPIQEMAGLKITHAARDIDPATGITKADLVRYYAAVADWALPHLRGRPLFIRRAPQGVQAPTVF